MSFVLKITNYDNVKADKYKAKRANESRKQSQAWLKRQSEQKKQPLKDHQNG